MKKIAKIAFFHIILWKKIQFSNFIHFVLWKITALAIFPCCFIEKNTVSAFFNVIFKDNAATDYCRFWKSVAHSSPQSTVWIPNSKVRIHFFFMNKLVKMEFFILFYEKHAILVITSKWRFFILFYEKMLFMGKKPKWHFFFHIILWKMPFQYFFFYEYNVDKRWNDVFHIILWKKHQTSIFYEKKMPKRQFFHIDFWKKCRSAFSSFFLTKKMLKLMNIFWSGQDLVWPANLIWLKK
jgi:hypothetical protein